MFYCYNNDTLTETDINDIGEDKLTVGYVTRDELESCYEKLGFGRASVEACKTASKNFRSGVEVHDSYTFTELRIIDPEREDGKQDCVALYCKKNLIVVVDVEDSDASTRRKLFAALSKYTESTAVCEKLIFSFFEQLVIGDLKFMESMSDELSELEESLVKGELDKDFNIVLLDIKKRLLKLHNYYEQILDITEAFDENENDIFDEDRLIYISNIAGKVTRLKEDADTLRSSVVQLQEAYSAHLDIELNRIMKIFTVITSVFFPITVIVGWYGMNFQIPEYGWRYGYLYVTGLSLVTIIGLFIFGKKKKWY